ncbi:hypothetical protein CR513_04117, partial [Mucuna pruriens]
MCIPMYVRFLALILLEKKDTSLSLSMIIHKDIMNITDDMMKLSNIIQVHSLNSFKNMIFVHNTQCQIHNNKMVFQKDIIEY